LMKNRAQYSEETMTRIATNNGSVQDEIWLTTEEKAVFRTAFEIRQDDILEMASARQPFLCQGQSVNLFFDNSTTEQEISRVHNIAFEDEYIFSLYYIRSLNGVSKHKVTECSVCEG